MIIVMKQGAKKESAEAVIKKVNDAKLKPVPLYGTERTVIAVIGDERILNEEMLAAMPEVEKVMEVVKPYKLASKEFHEKSSIIDVDGVKVGDKEIIIMAGPCALENREMVLETAKAVKESGAKILRGGAFKPRSSPYSFQGLGEEGLKYMAEARDETGLKIVTEVMTPANVELVAKYADILQIGTRNMQNFDLLKEVGKTKKPVLLKRGMSSTINEWLMSAEYILSEGNPNVILCERGIRTFETYTRNTLDLGAVAALKELTHLPVIVDPSHGTGKYTLVLPMARAGIAAGADGLIIETHPNPAESSSDADQTVTFNKFNKIMKAITPIAESLGRSL